MTHTFRCFAVRGKDGAYVGHGSSMDVIIWNPELKWAALYDTEAEAHAVANHVGNCEVVECEATLERED